MVISETFIDVISTQPISFNITNSCPVRMRALDSHVSGLRLFSLLYMHLHEMWYMDGVSAHVQSVEVLWHTHGSRNLARSGIWHSRLAWIAIICSKGISLHRSIPYRCSHSLFFHTHIIGVDMANDESDCKFPFPFH